MSNPILKFFSNESDNKKAFLEHYASCASKGVLKDIWQAKWDKEESLDLDGRKLTDLSPISELTHLKVLDVSDTKITDLSPITGLKQLTELKFTYTGVTDLVPISGLKNLEELVFYNSKVTDLKPISKLVKLTSLDFSTTPVADISPLLKLNKLNSLDFSTTPVVDISPLLKLSNLEYLRCSDTEVTDFNPISKLNSLISLEIAGNAIDDLTLLSGLLHLETLYFSNTAVADLTPIAKLSKLNDIEFSNTKVKDLSTLVNMPNLEYLDLADNKISDLYALKSLKQLIILDLSKTAIKDLKPLEEFTNLSRLYIDNTKVSSLEPVLPLIKKGLKVAWSEYGAGDAIYIENCPLTSPPVAVAKQGNKAIIRWFKENKRGGVKRVSEARLLLLGQGGAGKTTLKEKLRDKNAPMPKPDDTTRGINIELLPHRRVDGSDFMVHVWDFGGQNIQKYAHQFFLTDSVVYAVLSNEREQNPNFQYWLNIIELLGKDSPVFIVQNERDGHVEPLKDVAQIRERFPQTFRSVEQVNLKEAATDTRFDALKIKLFHAATHLPHTQKEYLGSFVNIRYKLQRLAEQEHSISFKKFKKLCRDEGIKDVLLMKDYAYTFTFLGIALHFADDIILKDRIFLRPKWMIDALFKLLYHPTVEAQNGRFSENDADKIWEEDEYDEQHGLLLRLLKKFQLCYPIEGTREYIVPQRLPVREQAFVPSADATQIRFAYKFMPSGILTQLTCQLHRRIDDDKVWGDAVQLTDKNEQAKVFIREVQADHILDINAFGKDKGVLLNRVIDALDDIHANSKFANLQVQKLVPCPCDRCDTRRQNQENAEFFDYDFLLELLQDGETESDRCKLSKKKFPIRHILNRSELRVFSRKKIRKLLAADQIDVALGLLRGKFEDNDEVIIQISRLRKLQKDNRTGQMTKEDYTVRRSQLLKDALETLDELM